MSSNLYERHLYLNPDIPIISAHKIREYDMTSGGLNVLIKAGALSDHQIKWLKSLPKKDRNIQIGLLLKNNKELVEIQNAGFVEARKNLFEANDIEDSDVLSIKKDAVFLIDKSADVLKFNEVEFRLANTYTSFYKLGQIEFYFKNAMSYDSIKLDIKNMHPHLELHQEHFLKFLITTFKSVEELEQNAYQKKLKRFAIKYKNRELDTEFYREFNDSSMIKLNLSLSGGQLGVENFDGNIDDIDIGYNYMHFIIPLIRLLM